jgi:hypothetical protein
MRRTIVLGGIAVVAVLVVTSLASGRPSQKVGSVTKFSATINAGQVVPHPKGTQAGASGQFTATLTGTTLKWTLAYAHLSGPATAAHIHWGARGKNGIALVALCPPCKSPLRGAATAVTDDVAALMAGGKTYVNVHTARNEEGEIRGQIRVAH